jgi:hypothetical protein
MVRYKRVELEEGTPIQFLGIYATRWPYDSGVEPTVGFIEDEDLEGYIKRLEDRLAGAVWLMNFTLEAWMARWDAVDDGSQPVLDMRMDQIAEWLVKESNG